MTKMLIYFHQGASPVRKSVSVQGARITFPSVGTTWARASDKGAGPRTTLPSLLYWDPWQGHLQNKEKRKTLKIELFYGIQSTSTYINLFSALFHGTTQPRWVHTAFKAKSARFFSSSRIK